ncbi:hypothetical protein COX84_06570, partial [Candidatus Micrarchaeota archaeon CG_4_10_14_0_2_um_filter_49_7]
MNIYRWHKNGVMNATMPNPFYDVGSNNTTQGLVLYLPFNNDTKDYSGLGNHGTSIAGVDCGIGISGKIGTGCSFPGSHSYINITNGISLNLSTTGALAAWIKTSVSSGHAHIFGKGNWQNDVNGYIFEIYNNNLMVELADASGYQQIQISGVTVANNNWHYVVFTWNDSIYLYMDGASVMTPTARTKTPKSDVYNLWIGDSHVYTSASYSGSMDEVAIWNRTLSANEVKALYYGGVTGGSVLNSSLLSNGDNWTVEVTPCDYLECGTPANSSVLSIMNAPTQGTPLLNSTDYPTNRTTG